MSKNILQSTISRDETETAKIAQEFAKILTKNTKKPQIICLSGTLGAGKSVFARALIKNLMNDPHLTVPSPTFTLVQTYESPYGPLYHYDLYRLEDPEEIYELGWEDSLIEGISIIEWPCRLAGMKPPSTLDIHIEPADNKQERTITITQKG